MNADRSEDKGEFVEVKAERLFGLVKAILRADMEQDVLKEHGEVTVILALKDAESIKSFVQDRTKKPSATNAPAMNTLAAAMPLDFGHCRRRSM